MFSTIYRLIGIHEIIVVKMVDELIGGTFFNDFGNEAQIDERSEIFEIYFVKSRFFSAMG